MVIVGNRADAVSVYVCTVRAGVPQNVLYITFIVILTQNYVNIPQFGIVNTF